MKINFISSRLLKCNEIILKFIFSGCELTIENIMHKKVLFSSIFANEKNFHWTLLMFSITITFSFYR